MEEVSIDEVGIPPRPFFYTIDQVANLLSVTIQRANQLLWFEGRSVGSPDKDQLRAVNIARATQSPDWRVTESELVRWMRYKDLRIFTRSL